MNSSGKGGPAAAEEGLQVSSSMSSNDGAKQTGSSSSGSSGSQGGQDSGSNRDSGGDNEEGSYFNFLGLRVSKDDLVTIGLALAISYGIRW